MAPWGTDIGGLELDQPFSLTPSEWDGFVAEHSAPLGFPDGMPMMQLWARFRPDLIKTHRMNMRHQGAHVPGTGTRVPFVPADLHTYLLTQYQLGVEYELVVAGHLGWSREEILDVFAVASLDTLSRGLHNACSERVVALIEGLGSAPAASTRFPSNWSGDPARLKSGIDLHEPGLTSREATSLRDWYMSVCGEVPAWFDYLSQRAPGFVKAQRVRVERALAVSPPAALPFYRLHHHAQFGDTASVREHALMALGLGMTVDELHDTVIHACLMTGGPTTMNRILPAIADLLER